jgi:uncharacterized damage-inducible protein DinB
MKMDPYVEPHLKVLEDLRRQVIEAAAPLDDDQINRAIPGLSNTAGIVLRHMAGSERYWIGEVTGGRPAHRDRDAEFGKDRLSKDELLADLQRVAALSREVLEGLSKEDLTEDVEARRPSGPVRETRLFALLHATQHMAYHLGQIRIMAKLLR